MNEVAPILAMDTASDPVVTRMIGTVIDEQELNRVFDTLVDQGPIQEVGTEARETHLASPEDMMVTGLLKADAPE